MSVRICRDCAKYANCTLRFDEEKRDTCPILNREDAKLSYRNDEGYPDPTSYHALIHIEQEKRREASQLAHRKDKPKTRPLKPRTQVVHYD